MPICFVIVLHLDRTNINIRCKFVVSTIIFNYITTNIQNPKIRNILVIFGGNVVYRHKIKIYKNHTL